MNAQLSEDKKFLTLTIPLSAPRLSSTGGTYLVATESGGLGVMIKGHDGNEHALKISCSIMYKNPDQAKKPTEAAGATKGKGK